MSVKIPATAEIAYVEAVEASCHQNGSAAYYYCTECDAVFDEDFVLTNRKNLVIPYTAEIIHVDAVEAVCHQVGNVEFWYCSECEAVFTDAALTQLSNFKSVIIPAPVELTYVPATDADCVNNGNVEYWYCAECEAVFADAMGAVITNLKNVVVPALGHTAGEKVTTVEPTETTDGAWEIRCTVCGELLESGTIPATAFIIKATGSDYVKSIALDGETIVINAKANGLYAKFSIGLADGVTVASDAIIARGKGFAVLSAAYGENITIVATNANGETKTYTVAIDWDFEFIGGYTVDKVEESEAAANTLNVYAKPGMNNASVGVRLAANVTYTVPDGLTVVKNGGYVYFKALEAAANDTYEVILTGANGETTTLTLNFVFDFENVDGVAGGWMVDSIDLADGNVVNITAPAAAGYASFRFLLANNTSDVTAEAKVEVVNQGTTNIHWMKLYNDGTNFVTAEVYVENTATGVVETYTVNVTFGE